MTRTALIVGGSLCGLACGVALSRAGFRVRIVERSVSLAGGSGLGIDLDLLSAVVGVDAAASLPVVTGNRHSTSWKLLHGWLAALARDQSTIEITEGAEVRAIGQQESSAHVDVEGRRLEADIVIGCDGYRSIVRGVIDPERPHAVYTGYMLWRGLIEERMLPSGTPLPGNRVNVQYAGPYRLVSYAVPGPSGATEAGHRQINFAWYDAHRDELLRVTGALRGGVVMHGLTTADIPRPMIDELVARALKCWDAPWGPAIAASIAQGQIFATPIAEYMPERLVSGRIAMLGDAAHVVSPMTGAGYVTGLEDIRILCARLKQAGAEGAAPAADVAALKLFEHDRLPQARRLVAMSQQGSRQFLAGATDNQSC